MRINNQLEQNMLSRFCKNIFILTIFTISSYISADSLDSIVLRSEFTMVDSEKNDRQEELINKGYILGKDFIVVQDPKNKKIYNISPITNK